LRHVAAAGDPVLYFSYEHDASTVLGRLLAIEAAAAAGLEAASIRLIRQAMEATDGRAGDLADRLRHTVGAPEAVTNLHEYADRFLVHRSNGGETSVFAIRQVVDQVRRSAGPPPLVVVDYLQKVLVPGGSELEDERVTKIVEGLKDLALELDVPVLAVVAADREGIVAGRRLRVHQLRGSSALAYEADVVLLMNEKYDVVARHHLVYDMSNAERYRNWAVVSVERNRSGLYKTDLEFRKRFEQGRFDLDGQPVAEQLVDERVYVD
jgi:replicative DNA helicase